MNRKALLSFFMILGLVFVVFKTLPAAGKPDVTRHEATFLGGAVNMHIEWQSPNPIVTVRISIGNKQQDVKVDLYDNRRNPSGYGGEVNVTIGLDWIPNQPFNYVIQLEDELRMKSELVTGKVRVTASQQIQYPQYPQQPSMQIQIQQNISQPDGQFGIQPGALPSGILPGALPGVQSGSQQVGALIVVISPRIIAQSGAMWRAGGGPWKRSEEAIPNLPAGFHTIEFQDVGGWIKPENQKVMIEGGQTLTINVIYYR